MEQLGGAVGSRNGRPNRSSRASLQLQVLGEPIGQDVVLLGTLLGNQSFKSLAEQLLVALCARLHDIQ